jgi:hypothetical protein
MPDLYDLLNVVKADPAAMKKILEDKKQVASYSITSEQLGVLKGMTPEHIKLIVEGIESRLTTGPVAGTNACPGTFACVGSHERLTQVDSLKNLISKSR